MHAVLLWWEREGEDARSTARLRAGVPVPVGTEIRGGGVLATPPRRVATCPKAARTYIMMRIRRTTFGSARS